VNKNSVNMRFVSRYGLKGELRETLVEKGCGHKKPAYRWCPVLAVLDDKGRWLYTEYWKRSQRRKAIEELKQAGFKEVEAGC